MRDAFHALIITYSLTATACTERMLPELGEPFPITVPAAANATSPRLAQGMNREVILSWMESTDDGVTLLFSRYAPDGWLPAVEVTTDPAMFVNWADLPGVTPLRGRSLLAHWLRHSGDASYAYDVVVARSDDDGESWGESISPHTDGTASEHGFVSVFADNSDAGLIWLDGRKTIRRPGDDMMNTGMTLRGATLTSDGRLLNETVLDELVCDCCQTDVAISADGPVAVYRDRTADEVRDIYVSRFLNGRWLPGQAVALDNWIISGCPVNGPAIDVDIDLVVVAWFSAPEGKTVIQSAVSKNSGRSFAEPVVIATSNALGQVGVSVIDSTSYAVSWLESGESDVYAIKVRTLSIGGILGRVQTVGRTKLSRNVPQMRRVDDKLIVAWSDEISDARKLVSVRVPILGFYDR